MDKVKYQQCPICKGQGIIKSPFSVQKSDRINHSVMAKLLRKEGYSFREIGKFLGYKNPQSVVLLLK